MDFYPKDLISASRLLKSIENEYILYLALLTHIGNGVSAYWFSTRGNFALARCCNADPSPQHVAQGRTQDFVEGGASRVHMGVAHMVSGGKKRPSISQLYGEIPYNGDILSNRAIQRAPDGTSIADATGGAGSNTHGVKLGWIVGVLIPCLLNIWGVMLFLRMAWVVGEAGIGHSLVIIGISYVVCIITTLSLSAITTNGEVKGGECMSYSQKSQIYINRGDVLSCVVVCIITTLSLSAITTNGEVKGDGFFSRNTYQKRPSISQLYGEIPYNGVSGGKKRPSISQLYGEIPYNGVSGGKKRPSISQLYGEIPYNGDILSNRAIQRAPDGTSIADATGGAGSNTHGVKLGWIVGVLIPCLLNIWGVMLFLRMAWVVGEAGIGHSLVIIGISYVVCIITTLSLSAITTNGEVKGGGIYFIISRSLGPEFGASIGIILAFANAVAASMNTIGFCNSLNDLLASYHTKIIDGGVNDIRLVGVIAILIMVIICSFGMDWESKAQNVLLVLIVIAIIDFLIGAILGPQDNTSIAQGFVGFNSKFKLTFQDPGSAIPKGTLLALLITAISYVAFVLAAGGVAVRAATGNVTQLPDAFTPCDGLVDCAYGLQRSYTIMQLISSVGIIIYIGCFAATLSTALTNLLSVPRLLQALGIDRIYPGFIYLSKAYGRNKEPYRGYVLTFLISSAFVLIALGIDRIYPGFIYLSKAYGRNKEPYRGYVLTFLISSAFVLIGDNAFEYRLSVLVLRVPGGLDYSHTVDLPPDVDEKEDILYVKDKYPIHSNILQASSDYHLDRNSISAAEGVKLRELLPSKDLQSIQQYPSKKDETTNISARDHPGMNMMQCFDTKTKRGTIDVWWLYDNGGLTILLPHILSSRNSWSTCKLRIFAPARHGQDLEVEEQNMADLLSKFRIKYSSLKMISDISKPVQPESEQLFDSLIHQYRTHNPATLDVDLDAIQGKTNRHLRLRELLLEHSNDATLVIISRSLQGCFLMFDDVNWGSSTQAQTYKSALASAHKLMFVGDHVKNYRPQILVLCGQPQVRPPLIDLAHWFTKSHSLLICADVVKEKLSFKRRTNRTAAAIKWLQQNKDKAFYVLVDDGQFDDNVAALMKSAGLGKLRPNVIMLGFKNDWMTCPVSDLNAYYNVIQ
ncbi:bumetanide-sensitive sodium-(potassium)-chloride cotransporter [Diaphorina citri]|uniref:Bumetanide-sensitive sodium-(Potassium)-chloride cotransporter n=1 Tax=Diaphorina citri TaxID=121845 RepID=A0A3Q0JF97_DIACI|nr:bumetanide-sensitive sodium-(potassium)-chloride cotransporter [Diaphorina citri]